MLAAEVYENSPEFSGTEPGCVQWSFLLLQGICTVPKWAGGEDEEGKGRFHFGSG